MIIPNEAVSRGSTELSARAVVGMKKKGMAMPLIRLAMAMWVKSMLDAKPVRHRFTQAMSSTPKVIKRRMSILFISRATIGDTTTASMPWKAMALPAQPAV